MDIDLHDDGSASLKKAGIRGRGRTKMTRAVAVAVSSGSSDHSWGTGRRHSRGVLPGLPAWQEFPFACGVSFRQAEITHSLAKETLHSEKFHYKSYMVQHACQKAFDDMELIADAVARAYEGAPMKSLGPRPTLSNSLCHGRRRTAQRCLRCVARLVWFIKLRERHLLSDDVDAACSKESFVTAVAIC